MNMIIQVITFDLKINSYNHGNITFNLINNEINTIINSNEIVILCCNIDFSNNCKIEDVYNKYWLK